MPEIVPVVLASWLAVVVLAFRMLPLPRRGPGRADRGLGAAAGRALRQARSSARPRSSSADAPALAVPTAYRVNKATAIGLGCLVGMVIFDWRSVRRLRWSWLDLPVAAWCALPVVSALANGLPIAEGLDRMRYLALAWGRPYLLGRVLSRRQRVAPPLRPGPGHRRPGLRAALPGGVPVRALPLRAGIRGPSLPDRGGRPLGGLEAFGLPRARQPARDVDGGGGGGRGLALAIGPVGRTGGIPGAWQAGILVGLCLIDQSHGAIALMAAVLRSWLWRRRPRGGCHRRSWRASRSRSASGGGRAAASIRGTGRAPEHGTRHVRGCEQAVDELADGPDGRAPGTRCAEARPGSDLRRLVGCPGPHVRQPGQPRPLAPCPGPLRRGPSRRRWPCRPCRWPRWSNGCPSARGSTPGARPSP